MRHIFVTVYQILVKEYDKESQIIGEGSACGTAQAQIKFW
jgi:hypothetical protein